MILLHVQAASFFHFYTAIITFKQHQFVLNRYIKNREYCTRAAMKKCMSGGSNFINFGYASNKDIQDFSISIM